MKELTGEERAALRDALLEAFPVEDDLKLAVDLLGLTYDHDISGETQRVRVHSLVVWAEARGRLDELVRVCIREAVDAAPLRAWADATAPELLVAEPPKERQWVWFSSIASVEAGKVSVLAVVETVVLSVGVVWVLARKPEWVGGYLWLSIGAPLVLLRTPTAVKISRRWALQPSWVHFTFVVLLVLLTLLGTARLLVDAGVSVFLFVPSLVLTEAYAFAAGRTLALAAARYCATATGALLHPLEVARRANENWRACAYCADLAAPPQLIHGLSLRELGMWVARTHRWDVEAIGVNAVMALHWYYCCFPLAWALRASAKVGLLIWIPFVRIEHSWKANRVLHERLADLARSPLGHLGAAWSVIVLIGFCLKVALYNGAPALREAWAGVEVSGGQGALFLADLIVPESIPAWQLCSLAAALLFLTRYVTAAKLLTRYHFAQPRRRLPKWATPFFQWTGLVRTACALAVQITLLFILWRFIYRHGWPDLPPVLGWLGG